MQKLKSVKASPITKSKKSGFGTKMWKNEFTPESVYSRGSGLTEKKKKHDK